MLKQWILIFLLLILAGSSTFGDTLLGRDKIAHFSTSMYMFCWNRGFGEDILEMNSSDSRCFGVGIALALGFGKEGSDLWVRKTEWSWGDIVWDVMGIGCGLVVINNNYFK